jgi:hypothetical protein
MDLEPKVIDTDVQCARCGSSMDRVDCYLCGGEGFLEDDDDVGGDGYLVDCLECGGTGGFWNCMATAGWCNDHPRPGREDVERHTAEWFEVLSDGTIRIVARTEP